MQRVLRYDGLLPARLDDRGKFARLTSDDIREMKTFVDENRTLKTPFDIVVEGTTPGRSSKKAQAAVRPWAEAGATWWIEAMWGANDQAVLKRVRQGPPRLD
jgi:hypothetical protein